MASRHEAAVKTLNNAYAGADYLTPGMVVNVVLAAADSVCPLRRAAKEYRERYGAADVQIDELMLGESLANLARAALTDTEGEGSDDRS